MRLIVKAKKTMSIKNKIFLSLIIVLILGFVITGFLVITQVKKKVTQEIVKQLNSHVLVIKNFIKTSDMAGKQLSKRAIEKSKAQLQGEIEHLMFKLKAIATNMDENQDEISLKFKVSNAILNTKIGKTGYAYALDLEGNLVVSAKNQGKNISDKPYIKEILKKKTGVIRYQDLDDPKKPWVYAVFDEYVFSDWIVVITISEKELLEDSEFIETSMINDIKNEIKKVKIGETGYFYIMNSKGTLIVHPKSEGKNISKYPFIQEMIKKKAGVIQYPWEGKNKVVAYTYYPERDWIIAGGSYLHEFIGSTMTSILWRFIIISVIIIFVILIILSWIFSKNVIKPIKQLEELFSKIAAGNLTNKITNYNKDEIGTIIEHVDDMVVQMNSALCKVKNSTTKVNNSAHSLANSSSEMEAGAENQSQQVTQVEVAIHEMTSTIQEISQNVEEVTSEINIIKDSATTGGEILEETVASINNLSNAVINTADSIKDLGKSSEQIGEILSVISDIADQTNLLALNAAIEAARAGEHGRGFAVVADEVRKLAERTVNATSEIESMIQNIQKEVNNSVGQMDKGVQLAEEGGAMVGNLKMSLQEIINGVIDIANKIGSIAAAVEEQSATSQEISNNMEDISTITRQSSSIAKENNNHAKDLMILADELKQVVIQFQLKDCDNY